MRGWGLALVVGVLGLLPSAAGAHLFHKFYESPETQLTRDYRVLHLLLEQPEDHFDLARRVYDGETRVRLKPGGFRRWLVRPAPLP